MCELQNVAEQLATEEKTFWRRKRRKKIVPGKLYAILKFSFHSDTIEMLLQVWIAEPLAKG